MAAKQAATEAARPRLTKSAVAARALAIADESGVGSLTIRRLAQELGVTPMALYWHFRTKEELLAGLADQLWSDIDLETDPAAPWPDQLRSMLESLVGVLRAHPSGAQLIVTHDKQSEGAMRAAEAALDLLRGAGFDDDQASEIAHLAMWTALTLVMSHPGHEPDLAADLSTEERAEALRRKQVQFAMLPTDKFPNLVECAIPFVACDTERHYRIGIDVFVAGVTALATGPAAD